MLTDEIRLRILRELENDPGLSQRDLAKALGDFAKKVEQLVIKGGYLGDDLLSAEEVLALSKLPSMEELQAMILGLIQGPARNLATVVAGGVRPVALGNVSPG